jgi:hypothetical protein
MQRIFNCIFLLAFCSIISSSISCKKNKLKDKDGDGVPACNDCNDDDPNIYPGADEICDNIDNDCDGLIDDEDVVVATEGPTVYPDQDEDGYGDPSIPQSYCANQIPDGLVIDDLDCDDSNPDINPSKQEVCDTLDNDCDGLIDDADESVDPTDGSLYFIDQDLDGYGNQGTPELNCDLMEGYSENSDDCDDNNALRNPGEEEVCDDDLDNDCDYFVDRNDPDCIAQEPISISLTVLGTQIHSQAGYSVSSAGDVNNDGWPDMLIGSPGVGNETGAAYLYISTPSLQSDSLYDAGHVFRGANLYSRAGSAVGHVDFDGDSRSDILIGAPYTGLHENTQTDYGSVYLFKANSILASDVRGLEDASIIIDGPESSLFGSKVSGIGDTNGDGLEEFLVSAPETNQVFLFQGGETVVTYSDSHTQFNLNKDFTGTHGLVDIGDVNGDGFAEVFIGAPESSGDAHLFSGSSISGGELSSSDATITFIPETTNDSATQIASIGDLDEDSLADFLIGAPQNSENGQNAGKVYLFFAHDLPQSGSVELSSSSYQLYGNSAGDRAGFVYDSGDMNSDGINDLIIGAPGYDDEYSDQGKLYLLVSDFQITLDKNIDSVATQSIIGTHEGAEFGRRAAYVGDVNRRGRSSILLGNPTSTTHREEAGKAHLLSLQTNECEDCSETCNDLIDNDGDDFIDCKDQDCENSPECQSPEVCYDSVDNDGDSFVDCDDQDCRGNSVCPVVLGPEFLGEYQFDRAGWSVTGAGDVDGDGLDDVLIGAPNHSILGENNGKVYLLYGSTIANVGTLSLQMADLAFLGEGDGDLLGWSLSSAGDIDNDGLADIMFAAPWSNSNGENAGKVYIFLGSSLQTSEARIPLSQADYIFEGAQEFSYLGKDLDGNFDINGDGNNDIVLSSLFHSPQGVVAKAHIVTVNLLDPGTYNIEDIDHQMSTDLLSSDDLLHQSYVAALGDIDGDGADDIALGSRGVNTPFIECGGVYIAYGSSVNSSTVITPDIHLYGAEEGSKVGYVHSAGDINKDGLADILVGQDGVSSPKSFIFHGVRVRVGSKAVPHADFSFDSSGERFTVLPDVDNDGFTDYLFHDDTNLYLVTGATFPHYGEMDFPWDEATHTFSGKGGEYGNFGSVGDINGDGISDIFLANLFFNSELGQLQWHQY